MSNELIVALITALLMAMPGLILNLAQAKKNHADIALIYQKAAERSERLRQNCEQYVWLLEVALHDYADGADMLSCQLLSAGLEPSWTPKYPIQSIHRPLEVDHE